MTFPHECGRTYCGACLAAVTRTYFSLRNLGEDHRIALRAAVTVLSLRHPGRPKGEYMGVVSAWIGGDRET